MKHLVIGGCSFSDGPDDWPTALVNSLENYTLHNTARGSSGNEIISRRVIHKVNELLQSESAEDIIVGIMWSGVARRCFYSDKRCEMIKIFYPKGKRLFKEIIKNQRKPKAENPEVWPKNDTCGMWLNATPGMDYTYYHAYIRDYYNDTQSTILTLEHILRTQWFLENKSIKYFMVPYMGRWMYDNDRINPIQIDYLWNMVDKDKWLPVAGEYEWVKENSTFSWRNKHEDDHHPSQAQHEDFVNQVILPWLKEKQYA